MNVWRRLGARWPTALAETATTRPAALCAQAVPNPDTTTQCLGVSRDVYIARCNAKQSASKLTRPANSPAAETSKMP